MHTSSIRPSTSYPPIAQSDTKPESIAEAIIVRLGLLFKERIDGVYRDSYVLNCLNMIIKEESKILRYSALAKIVNRNIYIRKETVNRDDKTTLVSSLLLPIQSPLTAEWIGGQGVDEIRRTEKTHVLFAVLSQDASLNIERAAAQYHSDECILQ